MSVCLTSRLSFVRACTHDCVRVQRPGCLLGITGRVTAGVVFVLVVHVVAVRIGVLTLPGHTLVRDTDVRLGLCVSSLLSEMESGSTEDPGVDSTEDI